MLASSKVRDGGSTPKWIGGLKGRLSFRIPQVQVPSSLGRRRYIGTKNIAFPAPSLVLAIGFTKVPHCASLQDANRAQIEHPPLRRGDRHRVALKDAVHQLMPIPELIDQCDA